MYIEIALSIMEKLENLKNMFFDKNLRYNDELCVRVCAFD